MNFTNCIFDHGEIDNENTNVVYINNCSFKSTLIGGNTYELISITNCFFKDNESPPTNMNVGILYLRWYSYLQQILVFNCTFINNTADIYQKVMSFYTNLNYDTPQLQHYLQTCVYLLDWYYFDSAWWVNPPETYNVLDEESCWGKNIVFYLTGQVVFNYTVINENFEKWKFGYVNCSFSGSLETVFNLEERFYHPLLFVQNCKIQNIQNDTVVIKNNNCIVLILNCFFINISNSEGQLGNMYNSQFYIMNSTFQSIYIKNQIQGLFYFENSEVNFVNIICENITTRQGGLFYGKNSIFDIENLTIIGSFSFSGYAVFFMIKGQINLTNSQFYGIYSNSVGGLCFQNVDFTNISNTSIDEGNVGVWINQGSQIYYLKNFSCGYLSGYTGVCIYIQEANVVINESQFLNSSPQSSIIYSTSSNLPCNISLFSIDFSYNYLAVFGINIIKTNLIMQNSNFTSNSYQILLVASKSFLEQSSIFLLNEQNTINSGQQTISLINSTLNASNLIFEMSYYSGCISASKDSSLFLLNINFHQCVISIKMSTNSFLNISTSYFFQNIALGEAGAGISSEDSVIYSFGNVFKNNSILGDLTTIKGSDIYAETSLTGVTDFIIFNSNFTFINGSSIYVDGSFNFQITNVNFLNISNQPSQCLYALNAINIIIQNIFLSNFSGYSAVEILSNYNYQMNILINSSIFLNFFRVFRWSYKH